MNEPNHRPRNRIQARRSVVLRDFAIFQLKLLLDTAKDGILVTLSVGALVIDLLSGGGRRPRLFYSVLALSERFDLWLNLSGAVSRLENEELDDEGLFGASAAGSDSLLGRIEEIVRGGDDPPSRKKKADHDPRSPKKPNDDPGAHPRTPDDDAESPGGS